MKKSMSTTSLSDIMSEVRRTKQTKVAQIDEAIDWAPVRAIIEAVYTSESPSYSGFMLFKIELLRMWYNLSDEEVEEMVNDSISFSRFVGLSLMSPAPDCTKIAQFRNALAETDALERALYEINRQLEAKGLVLNHGTIINATVTDNPHFGSKE